PGRSVSPAVLAATNRVPAWESFGLVAVPCQDGVLLTTRSVAAASEGDAQAADSHPSWDAVVRDSLRFGRDASGRFATVDRWLEQSGHKQTEPPGLEEFLPERLAAGWTEWEAPAGSESESLVIIPAALPRYAGIALGLAFLLAAWSTRGWFAPVWRLRLLAIVLVGGIAAIVCMPSPLPEIAIWFTILASLPFLVTLV